MAPQAGNRADNEEKVDYAEDPSIQFGKVLAHPKPGDEVVITGLAGTFPDSVDVHHFRDNLFNKVDMVSPDNRRWEPGHPEIPQRTGKIFNIEKFDAGYFGVHHRQVSCMDPMARIMLERVTEAIFDAGLHPSELEGTNTGVFLGSCYSESEKTFFYDKLVHQGYSVTGCERSMQARRVSYFFKLKGPSYVCDTACSSSLYALEHAYRAMRTGECEMAIVGGSNLVLHPFVSLQFARLGVLSLDGACKAFDNTGNGYARSEAIAAIILQKSKCARRIYSTILHAKTNCDGYKDSGITYPSGEMQIRLLREFYQECDQVKPTELSFLEAHGTGTKVGDPEELQAIEEIFLKGRTTSLPVGSIKSNIGHSEPTSGLCSITKAIIAFETGYIAPNLHYTTPRPGIKSLEDGRLKVITEKTPFSDKRGLIGINSFGFGGGNCHVLLRHNPKQKTNQGRPKDNIPRLVCVSGRTRQAIDVLLDDVLENHCDIEHIRLLQEVFRKNLSGHLYRGFSLVSKSGEITRSFNFNAAKLSTLVVCFGVIDEEIRSKAHEYLEVPLVSGIIQRIHDILVSKGIHIIDILSKPQKKNIFETVLANFALHVVYADLLKALDIVPDKVFGITSGLSLGTLACAYFDEALTLREALECCYVIAFAANSVSTNDGTEKELAVLVEKSGTVAMQLQQSLTKILTKPRRLSKRVIFEATPSEISSVYLTNCFGSLKVLNDVKSILGKHFTILELGNGIIHNIIEKDFGRVDKKFFIHTGGALDEFLISFGRLYELGFNPQIHKLFPKVEFPVSRGTPMISPKIKWNHEKEWFVTHYQCEDQMKTEQRSYGITLIDPTYNYMGGHVIDGRTLFPATGYLHLVWETLAHIHGLMSSDMKIVFQNCKFRRACTVSNDLKLDLTVSIQRGSGNFEVIEGDVCLVSGQILQVANNETNMAVIPVPSRELQGIMMTTKDVYKELRLRGYNYKGQFRAIKSCDTTAQYGDIAWDGNWVTFMDNMLQMKILQEDTRLLYVPTTIQRLTIDAKKHIDCVKAIGGDEVTNMPVYINRDTGVIRSGSIEIRGLNASSIPRRKYLGTPVLEKYVFVPNVGKLQTEPAVRVNMQILLENLFSIKIKAVELIDEATAAESKPLGGLVHNVLADQPLIQTDITILSKTEMEVANVKVEDKKLLTEVDCSLVVGSKLMQRKDVLQIALGTLKPNGFILSREPLDFDPFTFSNQGISLITSFTTDQEKLCFLKKNTEYKTPTVVEVSLKDIDITWLSKLKDTVQKDSHVLVCAQGEPLCGVLGLVSCLRREPGCQNVRLVFLPDSSTPEFSLTLPFYQEQLDKNLAINVFKNGQWGTYRHLLFEQAHQIAAEHCYLNTVVRGDLSSLTWLEGFLSTRHNIKADSELVSIYYSALNFRDIMTASGRINVDSVTRDRRGQECVQGFEFSGRTQSGKRVMGLSMNGGCASLIEADNYLIWEIPDGWSLADAATVPVVYATSIYALFKILAAYVILDKLNHLTKERMGKKDDKLIRPGKPHAHMLDVKQSKAKMQRGDSVLIHSGTGGVGQAAITLALHVGCTVYTTVGTPEKREYLKKRFPQLTDKNIANSRDISFEKHIIKVTNGRGVDIVLNSLAEEKLLASVRCLARGGRFVEIGKFDLASDNTLNLLLFEKEASFHGVMLDARFDSALWVRADLHNMVQEGIDSGAIRPLHKTIFNMSQPEEAFRYMGTGKHIGKVLIQVRQEEKEKVIKPSKMLFPSMPRYFCDEDKSYIICGGLGGFGLELADWLVLRGCRNLVLTSRSGIKTGYQTYRIAIWKSYGTNIRISTDDITTYEGCEKLILEANKLAPVHAIFNLAVVLRDALLENQTEDNFKVSFGPKAFATGHLDAVTRKYCPELRDFVVFSSVSCGRGNPGQTNYGMSNSIMERICEKRKSEGHPALAIQWGAIGDVGLVAELQDEAKDMVIGGTLQQRISNCLQCMDTLLRQNESPVVSSIVVAEKRSGAGGADNIVDAVANILGIKDLKCISLQATLAEVGMDSMTAVEIKQTLEREFEVFLTPQDIKSMTFAKLIEIQAEKNAELQTGTKKERAIVGIDMVLRLMGDPATANIPVLPISGTECESAPTVVIFPGIEGIITVLEPMYKLLKANLVGLQFTSDNQKDTIEDMARQILPIIEERISESEPYNIVSYSFGGSVALEVVHQLEQKGYQGTLVCIDASPDFLGALTNILEVQSDDKLQVSLIVQLMSLQVSYDVIAKNLEALMKSPDFESRLLLAKSIAGARSEHSIEHQRAVVTSIYRRLKALVKWHPNYKVKSKIVLYRPSLSSISMPDEDYGLSKYCEGPVEVKTFDGNHVTILENPELPEAINRLLGHPEKPVENGTADLLINGNSELPIEKGKGDLLIHGKEQKEPTKLK